MIDAYFPAIVGLLHGITARANLIPSHGACDPRLTGKLRRSIVATGMSDRILKSMRNGAVVGLIRGAAVGFMGSEATLGEVIFGLSGFGGAAFRGTVGSIHGESGGLYSGFALAEACQAAGAYD